jgi:hypothetical protein
VPALVESIPGYAEALARERELRELVFAEACAPIAGVEVTPLTLRKLAYLRIAGNRFVTGSGPVTAAHAVLFLWVASRAFVPFDLVARNKFINSASRLPASDVYDGIRAYLADAFFDVDGSDGDGSPPIASFEASVIDTIASAYGWTREAILDLSLPEVSQYLRLIDRRRGGVVTNPTSDRVKMKWLESMNNPTQTP